MMLFVMSVFLASFFTSSNIQVCNYHQQFYRPENLCIIITGQIDPKKVFETVKSFEDKILTKASFGFLCCLPFVQ